MSPGILLSPLIQLDAAQYTTLSVAALSVALVGRFRSLVVTALAGRRPRRRGVVDHRLRAGRQRHRQRARPGAAVLPPRRAAARRSIARPAPARTPSPTRCACRSDPLDEPRGPGLGAALCRRVIMARHRRRADVCGDVRLRRLLDRRVRRRHLVRRDLPRLHRVDRRGRHPLPRAGRLRRGRRVRRRSPGHGGQRAARCSPSSSASPRRWSAASSSA